MYCLLSKSLSLLIYSCGVFIFYMQEYLSEISISNSLEIWSPCFYGTSLQIILTKFYHQRGEVNSCETDILTTLSVSIS